MLGASAGFGVAGAMGLVSPAKLKAAQGAAGQSRDLELAYMSAGEQLKLFRQKKLSPVEVLQAQLRLTEQRGKLVNCFTFLHPEEALAQARESERRWQQGKRTQGLDRHRRIEGVQRPGDDQR
jgi:hypothetical protein